MRLLLCPTPADQARVAAETIQELVRHTPDAVLGLATGSSPLAVYTELGRRHRAGRLSLARAAAVLLDEYVGLPTGHPERYAAVIQRDLVDHVDLDPGAVHSPDGTAEDLDRACHQLEATISGLGGVDLQLLGIGANGHIAFNEPGTPLGSRSHVVDLAERTRRDNARFFDGDVSAVPTRALTQGLGTISEARRILLLAQGAAKARAVQAMVEGPVSEQCPASVLQRHPDVTVLLDAGAAQGLRDAPLAEELELHEPAPPRPRQVSSWSASHA